MNMGQPFFFTRCSNDDIEDALDFIEIERNEGRGFLYNNSHLKRVEVKVWIYSVCVCVCVFECVC